MHDNVARTSVTPISVLTFVENMQMLEVSALVPYSAICHCCWIVELTWKPPTPAACRDCNGPFIRHRFPETDVYCDIWDEHRKSHIVKYHVLVKFCVFGAFA